MVVSKRTWKGRYGMSEIRRSMPGSKGMCRSVIIMLRLRTANTAEYSDELISSSLTPASCKTDYLALVFFTPEYQYSFPNGSKAVCSPLLSSHSLRSRPF
jgi:hypothetical protein